MTPIRDSNQLREDFHAQFTEFFATYGDIFQFMGDLAEPFARIALAISEATIASNTSYLSKNTGIPHAKLQDFLERLVKLKLLKAQTMIMGSGFGNRKVKCYSLRLPKKIMMPQIEREDGKSHTQFVMEEKIKRHVK